jgi:hypothetical protein
MPSKPASDIADACARRARYLSHYARRMVSRCHTEADKNQVFAGAYVSYLTFFEAQIEALFVGLITERHAHPDASIAPTVAMPNSKIAKAMITGGRNYVDWLPFNAHTMKRAPVFLVEGRPFTDLSKPRRNTLDNASVLRNALAHQSDHALKRFEAEFVDGKVLPVSQRKPPGYLRGSHSLTRNRLEVQLMELVVIMRDLTV